MGLIDKYLLPRIDREFETEDDGAWVMSMRPRRFGSPVAQTSLISFRRPGVKPSSGFGIRLWALEKMAERRDEEDWIVTSSLTMTTEMAQQAMAWVGEIREGRA